MTPRKSIVEDRETALLDLLGGWLEMVESCHEAGQMPREEFEAEFFGEIIPETYEDWRAHYTAEYRAEVEELNSRAAALVLGEEDEQPAMSPAEFLREHVLPLFEED